MQNCFGRLIVNGPTQLVATFRYHMPIFVIIIFQLARPIYHKKFNVILVYVMQNPVYLVVL